MHFDSKVPPHILLDISGFKAFPFMVVIAVVPFERLNSEGWEFRNTASIYYVRVSLHSRLPHLGVFLLVSSLHKHTF